MKNSPVARLIMTQRVTHPAALAVLHAGSVPLIYKGILTHLCLLSHHMLSIKLQTCISTVARKTAFVHWSAS